MVTLSKLSDNLAKAKRIILIPDGLPRLAGAGYWAVHAFAVLALPHCHDPEAEIVRVQTH